MNPIAAPATGFPKSDPISAPTTVHPLTVNAILPTRERISSAFFPFGENLMLSDCLLRARTKLDFALYVLENFLPSEKLI